MTLLTQNSELKPHRIWNIVEGDCVEEMKKMSDCSVDSIVTDPPYELGFMGKSWDSTGIAYKVEVWEQCLRVLKPGGHLLAFGGSRTYHRLACAIEDAGFQIRDQIMWVYGSGFPKSLDVSKAIDKQAGAKREVIGYTDPHDPRTAMARSIYGGDIQEGAGIGNPITAPATDAAKQWEGWGTALKPAHEPIVLARKPLDGTVANNVLTHGVGGINIDGCRVGTSTRFNSFAGNKNTGMTAADNRSDSGKGLFAGNVDGGSEVSGRFPANFIHDGSDEVLELFPETAGGARPAKATKRTGEHYEGGWGPISDGERIEFVGGSAARFFYCAKANKKDRNEGLDDFPLVEGGSMSGIETRPDRPTNHPIRANHHPTVKPTDLMRYLCRLITPPNGTVLDPFTGSGSTGKAAVLEGMRFIGIEKESDYVKIAEARIGYAEHSVK